MKYILSLCLFFGLGACAGSSRAQQASRCGDEALRSGFVCVTEGGTQLQVLSEHATERDDACATARCAAGTQCVSALQTLGDKRFLLPYCRVSTEPGTELPVSRDPCAHYACPAAYHCTAPADAPYCVPSNGAW